MDRTGSIEVTRTQCGFACSKGTTDGIYLLKGVDEAYYAGKLRLLRYAGRTWSVVYKKAFDSVNHTVPFVKLRGFGAEEDVMRPFEGHDINSNGQLHRKGRMTDEFEMPMYSIKL